MWPGLGYLEKFSWGRGVPPTHISAHLNFKVKFLRERFHHLPKGLKIKEKYFEMWHILGYPVNFFSSILNFFLSSFFSPGLMVWKWPPTSSGQEKGKEGRPAPRKIFQGSQAYATFGTIVPHFLKILEHALNTPQMNGFDK